ncbi:hypothetical protein FGG08_000532 [Glutinoglossum americanum]|uniref:Secreted protein n=1 Tax=Glutinoglossum americanum TaxID=1670608 RepID=A0A9P8IF83_9PEZI|nr:hypothetical protein FGG08_000532 [Glutinoglossum americanum]
MHILQKLRSLLSSSLLAITVIHLVAPLTVAGSGDFGPDTCLEGWVWREAVAGDHVCVTPAIRAAAATDNSRAASRRNPSGGPFGPDTCLQGYVWREATPTDHVCVTPATRTQTANDNGQVVKRRVIPSIWMTKWFPEPVCNGDICGITSDNDIPRFYINGEHFNIGPVTVGVYRSSNGSPLWQTTLNAESHIGNIAGSFGTKTNVIDCEFSPTTQTNAYLRARDNISNRWSNPIYVKTGCKFL